MLHPIHPNNILFILQNYQKLKLPLMHCLIISLSNFLVQFPIIILGYHLTLGAFTYPLIFIITDLTVRTLGKEQAKLIIFRSMLPALFISYFISNLYIDGKLHNINNLFSINIMPLRISIACFLAYLFGQVIDINIFQKVRDNNNKWWLAPSLSGCIGNIIDTFIFFSVAFYQCEVQILREHWVEIALTDFCFKYIITVVLFIPVYGLILKIITHNLNKNINNNHSKNYPIL